MPKGAIPYKPGQIPKGPELKVPVGTYPPTNYFSNPSGQADGIFGGSSGWNNNPVGQYQGAYTNKPGDPYNVNNILNNPNYTSPGAWAPQISTAGQSIGASNNKGGLFSAITGGNPAPQMYNENGLPIEYEQHSYWNGKETVTYNPVAYDDKGNKFIYDDVKGAYQRDASNNLMATNKNTPASTYQYNPLLGKDYTTEPEKLTLPELQALFPGRTVAELADLMESRGYAMSQDERGRESWVRTGEPPKSPSGSSIYNYADTSRGRPEYVSGASLKPGERQVDAKGNAFVGGTPTAEGNAQYALTVAQNINKKLEKKGAYKWTSYTTKDKDGNWIRVYSKVLRAPYTQAYKERQAAEREYKAQAEAKAAETQAQQQEQGQNMQGLVTLRVQYG